MTTTPSNPKDKIGIKKIPMSTVPEPVIAEVAIALFEGARKYGRHNYRDQEILASVYYDALRRHIGAWWEGEDIDKDSQLNHVTKAISTLVVFRDAMMNDMWVDDRPPKSKAGWVDEMNLKAAAIVEKYPDAVEPLTEKNKSESIESEADRPQDRRGTYIKEGDSLVCDPSATRDFIFFGLKGNVVRSQGILCIRIESCYMYGDYILKEGTNQEWLKIS